MPKSMPIYGSKIGWALNILPIPAEYPNVRDKVIAEFFTNQIEKKLAKELKVENVTVYFQFKPGPRIWIQTPEMNGNWVA